MAPVPESLTRSRKAGAFCVRPGDHQTSQKQKAMMNPHETHRARALVARLVRAGLVAIENFLLPPVTGR